LIDNELVQASNGALSSRRNPVTGAVYTEFAAATPEDALAAVTSAAAAFLVWSKSSPGQRRDILLNAARLLKERAEPFMQTMVGETGASRP